MLEVKQKKCLNNNCNFFFTPRNYNHAFCSKKCLIEYKEINKKKEKYGFPYFFCCNCEILTKLDFNPKKNLQKWVNWICPNCGYIENRIELKEFLNIKYLWIIKNNQ